MTTGSACFLQTLSWGLKQVVKEHSLAEGAEGGEQEGKSCDLVEGIWEDQSGGNEEDKG